MKNLLINIYKNVVLTATFLLIQTAVLAQTENPFISRWQVGESDTISIPLQNKTYNFNYTWTLLSNPTIQLSGTHSTADGSFQTLFENGGEYSLEITGAFPQLKNYPVDKLLDITQWGDIKWESMEAMFKNWQGTSFSAEDTLDLSLVTNMSEIFRGASNFNDDLNRWNVQSIQNMQLIFSDASSFNGNISGWQTSSLTNLSYAFNNATEFNQDLNNWEVRKVQTLVGTFSGASKFNGDISNWITSNVTTMKETFRKAIAFNQDIGNWDVSKVKIMEDCFRATDSFNRDLSKWDVGSVTNMRQMFDNALAFNQPIGVWNVRNVTSFREMFRQSVAFNQSLGAWKLNPDANFLNVFGGAVGLDCKNWSSTIIGLNFSNPELENISFGGPNVEYDSVAARARDELLSRGWSINGIPFSGSCQAEHEFGCENEVVISNDTLYGNLYISAAKKVDLEENLIFEKPCTVYISAPAVSISPLVAIEEGIVFEIVTEPGCEEN